MDSLDFKKMDERFDNNPVPKGSPLSELDQKRALFIATELPKLRIVPEAPEDVPGLTPITHAKGLPATRRWYRRISSYEANGWLNQHTHVLNTKLRMWSFYILLGWGLTNHAFNGVHIEDKYQNHQLEEQPYDKIAGRELPYARIWSRPG
jgi:hypothetical protein